MSTRPSICVVSEGAACLRSSALSDTRLPSLPPSAGSIKSRSGSPGPGEDIAVSSRRGPARLLRACCVVDQRTIPLPKRVRYQTNARPSVGFFLRAISCRVLGIKFHQELVCCILEERKRGETWKRERYGSNGSTAPTKSP